MKNNEVTLLSTDDVLGNNKINVINEYGTKCEVTDFAIALGAVNSNNDKTSNWYLRAGDASVKGAYILDISDRLYLTRGIYRNNALRPVLRFSNIEKILGNININNLGDVFEIEYGEYPQSAASDDISAKLDYELSNGNLIKTGKKYTVDSNRSISFNDKFNPIKYDEYLYKHKKYIQISFNPYNNYTELSNGLTYNYKDKVWFKVSPIRWYVDMKAKMLVSKNLLVAGIRFSDIFPLFKDYTKTESYKFLNKYFKKDIKNNYYASIIKESYNYKENNYIDGSNPYNFSYDDISEEDIIEGAISSGVTVFLHGKSSEGKTARVKELDPTCEVLSLCSATPERLNGKSVYVSDTGEMKDVPPAWLVRLNDKCKREPDRLHILFLDELTNALPSIQGMAYDIVLERRVNDLWDLPDNARVVCAGNEMEDSIAANQLAEPLFNRCAHVYIKTTTDKWLEWASNNNIHPAIISYIAYTGGEALRSKFDGKSPNADPRKWEMASKMLYKTNNPLMLRSLVGEDITREFTNFCSSHCITMEDVLNGNYTTDEIATLNTSERYITIASLTGVGEDKLDIIRSFVSKLGDEYLALFDSIKGRQNKEKVL